MSDSNIAKLTRARNLYVCGTVKLFNVEKGYGVINCNDTREDFFAHQAAITRNNPHLCKNVRTYSF